MKRVTGIGGIFFKAEDPGKIKEWYAKHLGFNVDEYGSSFLWKELDAPDSSTPARTVWSPFPKDTTYFDPSDRPYMFNYRVENLLELVKILKEEGVTVVGKIEIYPYGKFAWIMDPEGNKIELWEPVDSGLEDQSGNQA
ncbi:MAG: VOC family protein [Cyclobacteriaceae bacterium]|nr:VOC family protein [Cyclobacteriaceae bacterium]